MTLFMNRRGGRSAIDQATLLELRRNLNGTLIHPSDEAYDTARTIWNGMIQRWPALIVRCGAPGDVVHAVRFARAHDLVFSVRSGGHNIAGTSLCDDGLVIDLSALKGIHVDLPARRVRVEAGCTLGEVDRKTQTHGLVVPSGIVSETGIAGLTLGGGFGWLTRKHGYTSDNLLSAQVVLPSGECLTVSGEENPDLFWGIRGGGGNFGIVTAFEFQAHPLGPEVTAGMVVWPFDHAEEVVRFYRSFAASLPDEAGSLLLVRPAPPAPFLPPETHGQLIVAIAGMYAGPPDEGERVFAPVHGFGRPLGGGIARKPFLAHQTMFDAGQPRGRQYYWKSEYLPALTAETGRVLLDHGRRIESPHSGILCFQLGGAISRIAEDASAAGHRQAAFVVNVAGAWEDPAEADRHLRWVRECWSELRPHSVGTYVNFLTEDDGEERVRAAYGTNLRRLETLKTCYDPANVMRANQNVRPRTGREPVVPAGPAMWGG